MPRMTFHKETMPLRVPKNLLEEARNLGLDARHWASIGLEKGISKKKRGVL